MVDQYTGETSLLSSSYGRDTVSQLIRNVNEPMFGSLMLKSIGKTLLLMSWTRSPGWSRIFTINRQIRLLYANWFLPKLRDLNFRGPKYLLTLIKCTQSAMDTSCSVDEKKIIAKESTSSGLLIVLSF
jgi:hypothetical protein